MRRPVERLRPWIGVLLLLLAASHVAATGARKSHPGPLGLAWGKSPPEAKSILGGKLTFVSEAPAGEAPYDTIDQHYSGVFGGLKVVDVMLRFYKGEFFYMLVKLANPQEEGKAPSPTQVFESVVRRMRKIYGEPKGLKHPPKLATNEAIFDNLPMTAQERAQLPYLWNEQNVKDPDALYRLRDQQILLGHWDPFADWRFGNGVIVQTFLWQELDATTQKPLPFQPVWIFCKEDRFKVWRAAVTMADLVPPRDF